MSVPPSLHAALPIYQVMTYRGVPLTMRGFSRVRDRHRQLHRGTPDTGQRRNAAEPGQCVCVAPCYGVVDEDRKSTRLNSSHVKISYGVFCLKKKKNR